jgi:hypothetical protein
VAQILSGIFVAVQTRIHPAIRLARGGNVPQISSASQNRYCAMLKISLNRAMF